jgi:hypothetical protein
MPGLNFLNMDTVKTVLQYLPPFVTVQGVDFRFKIIHESRELRLVYDIENVYDESPHFKDINDHGGWQNPFNENSFQGFLFLREGITDDLDLALAILECRMFFITNGIKIF